MLLALLLTGSVSWAEVRLNPIFSDGAVLQREVQIPIWGSAAEGEKVKVEFDGETIETVAKDGKWRVNLKPRQAGGPYELKVTGENALTVKDILVGEVWLASGQSNMEWRLLQLNEGKAAAAASENPNIRMVTIPKNPQIKPLAETAPIHWKVANPANTPSFSGVGYFFARDLQKKLGVPVGMIVSAYGGTRVGAWIDAHSLKGLPEGDKDWNEYQQVLESYPALAESYPAKREAFTKAMKEWNESSQERDFQEALKQWQADAQLARTENRPEPPRPKMPEGKPQPPRQPVAAGDTASLFNGMISPIIPYAIRGAIWYQGESDNRNFKKYRVLFPHMVKDWRQRFEVGEFPFLFVQIAPHDGMSPEIREAQLLSLGTIPNSAMAVTMDVGDALDIHPQPKEPVGQRLALAALALAYKEKGEYSGPLYKAARFEHGKAVVEFTHLGGGLDSKGEALKGFTIAGADGKFGPAKAEIEGETVVVSSETVKEPTAVRYGWAKTPDVNLYNKEGLPASPFRSDLPQK